MANKHNTHSTFVLNVKQVLESKHMSQRDLAQKMNMDPSGLNKYLTGKVLPGMEVICHFGEALDVEPWELLKPSATAPSPDPTEGRRRDLFYQVMALLDQASEQVLEIHLTLLSGHGAALLPARKKA